MKIFILVLSLMFSCLSAQALEALEFNKEADSNHSFVKTIPLKPLSAVKEIGYLSFTGDFTQGGLIVANLTSDVKDYIKSIKHNDKKIRVFNNKVLIAFGRDEKLNHIINYTYADGSTDKFFFKIGKRDYDVQRINGVAKKYVDPGKEFWNRIKLENGIIGAKRKEVIEDCNLDEGWQVPNTGRISGVYGSQRFFNGKAKRPHYGIDYAAPKGDPVVAPNSGKVTMVHQDMYYTGKTIIINHGCGLISVFLHLSETMVEEGQYVSKGQQIGKVGSTGRSTGPHLDWRLNLFKTRLDPSLVIN